MKQRMIWICALLSLLLVLAGCSASSNDYAAADEPESARFGMLVAGETADSGGYYTYDDYEVADVEWEPATGGGEYYYDEEEDYYEYEEEAEAPIPTIPEDPETGGGETPIDEIMDQPRKIIYNVDISLETIEFDEGVGRIPTVAESLGGFVQSSYIQGANMYDKYYSRSANFTVRIPSEELDSLLDRLAGDYHVVYTQKHSSDITTNYYDTKARLDSLRIQEERLKAMLEGAEELQYMLEVERELSNVLYQIERFTTALNRMDNEVNYSTITIYLQEVSSYEDDTPTVKPVTFTERMQEAMGDSWTGFVRFWQGLVLGLITLLPFLPVIVIVVVVIVMLARRQRRKRNASAPKQPTVYPLIPDQNDQLTEQQETPGDSPKDE